MQITEDRYAKIYYSVTNGEGKILDSSESNGPLSFIYGREKLMEGLENQLRGKKQGDQFSFTLNQEEAFGAWDPDKVLSIKKSMIEDPSLLEIGKALEVQHATGRRVMLVHKIEEDTVLLDGNHPWAGESLIFNVDVAEVREATAAEWQGLHSGDCCGGGGGGCGCGDHQESSKKHQDKAGCGCGGSSSCQTHL